MGKAKRSKVAKPKKKTDAAFTKQKKKVGKKILKTNETTISIKTRKIALPEQHASKDSSIIFKGKSISEYITGTKHTNSNQRVQNLVNIQEMLSTNLHLIEPNAGPLIQRLGVVLQDPEENVRSSALELIKTIITHIKNEDLLPFLQVFVAQLSSGMLHIDRGVQKTTVLVLLSLLQNHLASTMTHSEPLLSSLVTLMSTNKNKQNTLLYFQAIAYILKFSLRSEKSQAHETLRTNCVELYKYTSRREVTKTQPSQSSLLGRVCECALPHVETIWLEDTPSQVYAQAEPNVLKTASSLVDFLILLHRSELGFSNSALVKLNNIAKCVAGRFPLSCSVPNRDVNVLWSLNLKIAEFLVILKKYSKVERYFVQCFDSRIRDLTKTEVTEGLSLLSRIPSPDPGTLSALLLHSTHPTHAPLFLSHFVGTCWLHSVDLETNKEFAESLKEHIHLVAPDLVNSLYRSQRSLTSSRPIPPLILHLCLEKKVFSSLSETDQVKCLEVYFRGDMKLSSREMSDLGHGARSDVVRTKFYSILLALLHEERITIEDYISILLSQANKDDEDEDENTLDRTKLRSFTSQLLSTFSPLPQTVRRNLFQISLSQIVERLYAGLSRFSLAAYLIILIRFSEYSSSEYSSSGCTINYTTINNCESEELVLDIPESLITKLGKIICSLIFNNDSLNDWGVDIVTLAVKLSVVQHVIFRYITQQVRLENKTAEMLSWYLKVVLNCREVKKVGRSRGQDLSRDVSGDLYVSGVQKLRECLRGRVTEREFQELEYRIQAAFCGPIL